MNTLAFTSESQQALSALALKYELLTGRQVKWRKDASAALEMVLYCLDCEVSELAEKARTFLDSMSLNTRRQFLALQQSPVPEGHESSVQLYRGVAHRQLTPPLILEPVPELMFEPKMYRGTAYHGYDAVQEKSKGIKKGHRIYRGQSY